jgi:glutathione S-transferase
MLELYHSINSVCAQKVRIALEEKRTPRRSKISRPILGPRCGNC